MMDGWMDGWILGACATATIIIHEDERQCDRAAPIAGTECAREQPCVFVFVGGDVREEN